MQWKAKEPNGGFSTSTKLYAPVVNDETFGYDIVNVDSQYAVRRPLPPPPAPFRRPFSSPPAPSRPHLPPSTDRSRGRCSMR
jgi:hypothetical protein